MKRTLMQVYVKGSAEAVKLYQKAFDATLDTFGAEENADAYMHAELDVYGQIIAVSEARRRKAGDNMQFCLQFDLDEKDKILKAYEVLKQGAKKALPPDSCEWSPCVAGVVDKFGVNWCIYIA